MFFGGNFWSCGRRGDGRGIAPTFRRLHLMHRDVGLWKSRRLTPLPGPNIPGMDIPDAYSYLRNPPPISPAAAIRWQFPRFVPAVTLHPTPVRIPKITCNSRNPLSVILPAAFEEQAKGGGVRAGSCRTSRSLCC